MKATIREKSSDNDKVFTVPKSCENIAHLQTVAPVSSSLESSSEEEPDSDDGFRWVNQPLDDVMGVECGKFIVDELNIDPSSPFLLDILLDQPQVVAQFLLLLHMFLLLHCLHWCQRMMSGRLSQFNPNLSKFTCNLHGKLVLINVNLLQLSGAMPLNPLW